MTQSKKIKLSDAMKEVVEWLRRGSILVHYPHNGKTHIIIRKDKDRSVNLSTFRSLLRNKIIRIAIGDEYTLTDIGINIEL